MKKKVLLIIYMFYLVIVGKLLFTYVYNEKIIKKVERENYAKSAEMLTFANFYQPYIAHYNRGDIFYKQGNYSEAIKEYNKALEYKLPEKKECPIRINLALSIIKMIPNDYASKDNIDSSIASLKEARDVLLFDGCANDEETGHSYKAQKLKDEIDDMIEELEEIKEEQNQSNDNQGDENEDENDSQNDNQNDNNQDSTETDAEEQHINDIEQQFMEQQEQAYEERQEEMQSIQEMYNFDFNFGGDEGIW